MSQRILLKTVLWGLKFPNPIGIAAGLDKNAEGFPGLFIMGVGFVEIGTVTPKPQSGNPKPRIFQLDKDQAIVNRCGFNSEGHKKVQENLKMKSKIKQGILGINIGKNKDSLSAAQDYVLGVLEFSSVGDYLTINISSPNTPGLRQKRQALEDLLDEILKARKQSGRKIPILLKISPDLTLDEKKDIAQVVLRKGKEIDGLVISNTTVSRPDELKNIEKTEIGGLSGQPLKNLSTKAIKDMFQLTQGKIVIIGVGGVATGEDAYAKIKAGASLIQLYTALAFEGPPVVGRIKRELKELLRSDGYQSVQDAVGSDHR